MKDVVFEWYIPYVPDKKKQLLKAVMISATVVSFFDALFFAAAMLFVAVALAVTGFFLFRSWKLEYEYVYVNGDFRISRIIRKEKRKDVFHCDRKDIQYVREGKLKEDGCQVSDFSSGWEKANVYTLRTGNRLVYIEPNEEFLQDLRLYRKA